MGDLTGMVFIPHNISAVLSTVRWDTVILFSIILEKGRDNTHTNTCAFM